MKTVKEFRATRLEFNCQNEETKIVSVVRGVAKLKTLGQRTFDVAGDMVPEVTGEEQ